NGEIRLAYEKCHSLIVYEKEKSQQKLVQSVHVPKEIIHASINDIDDDPDRNNGVMEIFRFIGEASTKLPSKGLYFSGPFGVGKTYFLGAVANELKKLNISSMLIY